jgi:hypothetical protein
VSTPLDPAATWQRVVDNFDWLQGVARRMAACDDRLSAEDIASEAVIDILGTESQWDAARGSWRTWARLRVWKARTYAIRALPPRSEPLDHKPSNRPNHAQRGSIEYSLTVGSDGHHDRMAAAADIEAILGEATPVETDAILCVMHGWSPDMVPGGRKEIRKNLRRLRARVAA